jgi:hypothetical protein
MAEYTYINMNISVNIKCVIIVWDCRYENYYCVTSIRKSSKFLNLFWFVVTPVQTPKLSISAAMSLLPLQTFVA